MKILILEHSLIYKKLLKQYLEKHLLFAECKCVDTFAELKELKEDFDLYLVDTVLPDAQGEQIEYLVKKKKDVIVLTQCEDNFLQQPYIEYIIDYIIKDDYHTIDYLVKFVKSLYKNRKRNVLIINDNKKDRTFQKKILKKIKLNITEASSVEEAVSKMENKKFDTIITKLNLPALNGEDLIKKVREKNDINDLPIIVISENKDEKHLIKCLKIGANDYIKKPFTREELKIRVNNIFDIYDNFRSILESSQIDKLTQVYNRNYLETSFENLFNSFKTKCIVMLDIDHFKQINDTYGHLIGDEILKHFAEILKKNVRKSDKIIRYGGEEFLLFMPSTSKQEAIIILNKIKNSLKAYKDINYTFSAGVADEGETLAEMIRIADERLYAAKKSGRNKIVFN